MASGKTLQSTIEISGVLSPSLQSAIKSAVDRLEEMSKETLDSMGASEKLSAELDTQETVLKNLKRGYADFVLEGKQGSKEARQLADKIDKLSGDLSTNKKRMKEAEDAAEGLGDAFDDAEKDAKEMSGAVSSFIGNMAANIVSKLGEIASSFAELPESTREYREDMAKLDAAFTTSGHSVETAQKAYDGFYKILGESDRSVEAVNHLAEFTKNEQELAQWATIAAGVTAKFGDSLPIEGLTEAANETAKVGKVTGPLADALNWAGISEDKFNKMLAKCNNEQERASLITSTLGAKYEAAAAEYNNLTSSTQAARDATNRIEQAQASLGATLEPATTAWTNMKAEAFEAIIPVIEKVVGWMETLQTWMEEHPTAAAVITSAIQGIAVALGVLAVAAGVYTAAQWAMNSALLASPITWIIVGIVALVAALVALWNNCEGFRNFFIGMWDKIKSAVSVAVDWIKDCWEKIKAFFTGDNPIAKYFQMGWNNIKIIWDVAISYFKMIWDNIKLVFSAVKSVLSGDFSGAWESIKQIFANVGTFFSEKVWGAIKGSFANVSEFFASTFGAAWEKVKSVFSAGGTVFAGIKDGIVSSFKTVVNAIITGINKVVKTPFEGLNKVLERISGLSIAGLKPFKWLTWRAPVPQLPLLASGGFTDGVSIAGEAGTEAVISFDPAYYDRNVGIWAAAGEMLGVLGNAESDGGLTSKAGQLLTLDDFSLGSLADGTNVVIYYDFSGFTWSPHVEAGDGDDADDIMARLRAHEAEFFEWLEEFIKMREVAQYA